MRFSICLNIFTVIQIASSTKIGRSIPSACYYLANDTVFTSPRYMVPCGEPSATSGILNCCDIGANNTCLSNSICYDPNTLTGTYYLSPCTDPIYSASECPQYCSECSPLSIRSTYADRLSAENRGNMDQLYVVYDSLARLWRCCSSHPDGTSDCSDPTDETFEAPEPRSLSTIYPSSTSNPTGRLSLDSQSSSSRFSHPPSSSPTSAASITSKDAPTSTSVASSKLSSGTLPARLIAGIVIGSVAGFALIPVAWFCFRLWRRKYKPRAEGTHEQDRHRDSQRKTPTPKKDVADFGGLSINDRASDLPPERDLNIL